MPAVYGGHIVMYESSGFGICVRPGIPADRFHG